MNESGIIEQAVQVVLRRRWVLIGAVATVFALVGAYLVWAPPEYESYSSIVIDRPDEDGSLDVLSLGRPGREVLIEVEVLRSLDVAKRVARSLRLRYAARPPSDVPAVLFDAEGEALDELALARLLQRRVDVAQVRRDIGIIRVSYRSTDRNEAREIANLYASEYADRHLQRSREQAGGLGDFVETQLLDRGRELVELEGRLQDFQQQENAVALEEEARQIAQQMAILQSQRDQAQVDLEMGRAQLASLEAEVTRIEPNLAGRISSAGMESELRALQEELTERELNVERKYAQNPQLRGNEQLDRDLPKDLRTIDGLRAQIARRAAKYVEDAMAAGGVEPGISGESSIPGALAHVSSLKRQVTEKNIELAGLQARIAVLGQRIARYEREFNRIPAQARQIAALERDKRSTEETYQWLLARYEEARIAEQSEFGNVRILDTAELADRPVAPRKRYALVLGGLVGILLGLGGVFALEFADDRVRSPEDMRRLSVALAGVVPSAHRPDSEPAARSAQRVLAALPTRRGAVTVALTSPAEGDGVSTVAALLAREAARAGQRVLLVDTRTGPRSVSTRFVSSAAAGTADVASGRADATQVIQSTAIEGLYVIGGGSDHGASGAVGGVALLRRLKVAMAGFDLVLFDLPAFDRVGGLISVAKGADVTLVVARSGRTHAGALRDVMHDLEVSGAPDVLFVLNDFDARRAYGMYHHRSPYGQFGRDAAKRPTRRRLAVGSGQSGDGVAPRAAAPYAAAASEEYPTLDGKIFLTPPGTAARRVRALEITDFRPAADDA